MSDRRTPPGEEFGQARGGLAGPREENGGGTSGYVALPDGMVVSFRAVGRGDALALQRLHARCSGRSIELRFLGPLGELPDWKAACLARPEHGDHLALAAIDPERPEEIVAVVRFVRTEFFFR